MFERIVEVGGAWDRRDPSPSKNYGIHPMELRFVLKGSRGCTQFVVYTSMYLRDVSDELWKRSRGDNYNPFNPMGADVGMHRWATGDDPESRACGYSPTGYCVYDGSGLMADEFMPIFLAEGDKAVWPMLEDRYQDWILEGATPTETESHTPLPGRPVRFE